MAAKISGDSAIRLSLCMIVRDNEPILRACLESVRPYVDEMIVVDTGSVDGTPALARSLGAQLFEFPWCDDFAAARNQSLQHARGDWLFWMDSDDTIDAENGRQLRHLAQQDHDPSILGFVVQVHCPADERHPGEVTAVDHVKLIRNRPDLRFEFRIHEQILPAIRRANGQVQFTPLFVRHSGTDRTAEGRQRKFVRDLHLLHLELLDRPAHPFALFNLGMTYHEMGLDQHAADMLARSLAVSQADESHVRKAYALLVGSYARLQREAAALKACQAGLALFPEDSELLYRWALLAQGAGRFSEAESAYQRVLQGGSGRHFSSLDLGIRGYKARHNLAMVYSAVGRFDLAELQWRLVLDDRPEYAPAWHGLGEVLLRLGRRVTLQVEVDRMERMATLAGDALCLRGELAALDADSDAAEAYFRQAIASEPDRSSHWQYLCKFLFDQGRDADAEAALKTLIELVPADAAAHHNLGMLHARLGHLDQAMDALRQSLQLRPDHWPTWRQLAGICEQAGAISQAIAAQEEILRYRPQDAEATESLRRLAARGGEAGS